MTALAAPPARSSRLSSSSLARVAVLADYAFLADLFDQALDLLMRVARPAGCCSTAITSVLVTTP
jgi:hypothetical protein